MPDYSLHRNATNRIKWLGRLGLVVFSFFVVLIMSMVSQPSMSHAYQSSSIQTVQTAPCKVEPCEMMAQGNNLLTKRVGSLEVFSLSMTGDSIFPSPVSTVATGEAGAVLDGNVLIVRGRFRKLSSQLRDYATDPLDPPNPNITSAIHIHRGKTTENGPFQYALTVSLDEDKLGGSFSGEYTLTEEQLQALKSGTLYMDIHTKTRRGGELRGVFKA